MNRRSALTICCLLATAACAAPAERESPPAGTPVPAATLVVSTADWPDFIEAGGTLAGRESALVAARVLASVRRVAVEAGDRVQAGQLLVELDDADVAGAARAAAAAAVSAERGLDRARAELTAAEAAASLADVTYGRIASLAERKSVTAQELDSARAAQAAAAARVTAARAAVAESEAGLDRQRAERDSAAARAGYARVTAPFDGTVTERLVEAGDMASPGRPLVRVEDTAGLEAIVRLDESRARTLATGTRVAVVVDEAGDARPRDGRIIEVGRAAAVDARAIEIRVAVPADPALRPGTFVRVRFPSTTRRALSVPETAIVRNGQLTSVFAVENGTARTRLVRLGATHAGRVEVVAGIADGDRIVLSPAPAVRDGAPIVEPRATGRGAR